MLVLTRRENEKVLFPTLGISIELLRVQGNKARFGVQAPSEIPVLRHELAERTPAELMPHSSGSGERLRELANTVRRRLDWASSALDDLRNSAEHTSKKDPVDEIVSGLYQELESLEQEANKLVQWSDAARRKHILLVEDNVVERKLMAAVLELSGVSVTTAEDGRDALEFLSMHAKPDAVLVDMFMPRCDGPEFVAEVRSSPGLSELIIFAVSAVEPASLGIATGDDGINGWFPKPLEPAELVSVLDRRLNESITL